MKYSSTTVEYTETIAIYNLPIGTVERATLNTEMKLQSEYFRLHICESVSVEP